MEAVSEEAAILVLGSLLIILSAILGALPCARSISHAGFADFARSALAGPRGQAPPDILDRLTDQRVEVRTATGAKISYATAAVLMFFMVISIVYNIARERPRWMTQEQTAITLAMHTLFLTISATPVLTRRLKDVYYGLSMALLTAFAWCRSPDHFLFGGFFVFGLRMPLVLAGAGAYHMLAWNLLQLCVVCVQAGLHFGGSPDSEFRQYITFEIYNTIVILLASAAFQQLNLTEVRRQVQVGILSSEKSASMSLLDMLCDVVVELNSDLTVARDSRAMAALLLRNSNASLAGVPFCDFVSEAERQSFRDSVSAAKTGPEAAVGTCRARLSDSLQNDVNADIFLVKVDILDEDCRYIVGIREFADDMASVPSFQHVGRRRAHHQRSAQMGTPHSREFTDLLAGASSEPQPPQSAQPCPPLPGPVQTDTPVGLRFPELIPTTKEAKKTAMVETMSAWNVAVPGTACCPYHAYAADARAIVRGISQAQCEADFPEPGPGAVQCQECGVLWPPEDEHECPMCLSTQLMPVPGPADQDNRLRISI